MFARRKQGLFGMTPEERKQAREWDEKHRTRKPTWREQQERDRAFWRKQVAEQARVEPLRETSRAVPSAQEYVPDGPPQDPLAHVPPEDREEWRRREAIAQQETREKMKKVAPLYNKGGPQYLGDDPQLIGSVAAGTNRRRS